MDSDFKKHAAASFVGVDDRNGFKRAALAAKTVEYRLPSFSFPDGLAPEPQTFSGLTPGRVVNTAVNEPCDVLVLLYTEYEIMALLDVFTKDPTWDEARERTWYWYGHNFSTFRPLIQKGETAAIRDGFLGYLYAMKVGDSRVVFFKSELHPKTNGPQVPFIPVIKQLISELAPKLVISTGTAGGIGKTIQCGDVAITNAARFHLKSTYAGSLAQLNTLSRDQTQLQSSPTVNNQYVKFAAQNFTPLSAPGLKRCYEELHGSSQYSFLKPPGASASIYVTDINPAPGPQPMVIVSADYLTVDDSTNYEKLHSAGIMNDTDDAFAFFSISELPAEKQPKWLSVRNASEPQIVYPDLDQQPNPADALSKRAGAIYGVYQYCTTLNSAFAVWGVIAGI